MPTDGDRTVQEIAMDIKRGGWLLNVLVASGWLLLVSSFGILVTPHNVVPLHNASVKIAIMCIVVCAINWLGARQTRFIFG
jgi:hypothetical protein